MAIGEILQKFKALENPKNVEGMARFGIRPKTKVYGVSIPELRKLAKAIKKDHNLAKELWQTKIHEARILAGMIEDYEKLTIGQIKKWVKDFDSWDVCDQVCMNLLDKSQISKDLIFEFAKSKEEFIKRTAFSLMAALASHDKKMQDKDFVKFFPLIKRASIDERNFVKKAVNWALRGIGKRNKNLNTEAVKLAKELLKINSKSAKWIANDAIRELTGENVQKRLCKSTSKK
jgi:3-methyladenine DNA glycosylase AlkD